MISTIHEAHRAGVLVGTASPTLRQTNSFYHSPIISVIKGRLSFFETCAAVFSEKGHVRLPNFDNMLHSAHEQRLKGMLDNRASSRNEALEKDKAYCLITASWSLRNCYHFFIDSIGKLDVIGKFFNLQDLTFLAPAGSRFYRELFDELGLRYVQYENGTTYTADTLITASLPGITTNCSLGTLNHLKSLVKHIPESHPGTNVFIRRRARTASNEDNLLAIAREFRPFTDIYLEDYTLVEQISLLKGSELVIGAHGAGFTFTAFKERGAVGEIFSPKFANPPFRHMHAQSGLPYHALYPESQSSEKYGTNHVDNFHVDERRFREFMARLAAL